MNESRRNFLRVAAAAPVAAIAPQALAALPNLAGAGASLGVRGFTKAEFPIRGGVNYNEDWLKGCPFPEAVMENWRAAIRLFRRHERVRTDWERAYRLYREKRWRAIEPRERDARFIFRRFNGGIEGKKIWSGNGAWWDRVKREFDSLPAWARDQNLIAANEKTYVEFNMCRSVAEYAGSPR